MFVDGYNYSDEETQEEKSQCEIESIYIKLSGQKTYDMKIEHFDDMI